MKETKSIYFKIRLTPTEKRQLEKYAVSHHMSMSEAIKSFCKKIFQEEN